MTIDRSLTFVCKKCAGLPRLATLQKSIGLNQNLIIVLDNYCQKSVIDKPKKTNETYK